MSHRIEHRPAFVITGVKNTFPIKESFSRIPKIWQEISKDGTMERLYQLWAQADLRPAGILGITSRGLDDEKMMDYFIAVVTFADTPGAEVMEFPEDLESFKFPGVDWAIFEAKGALPSAVSRAYGRFNDWITSSGYIPAPLPVIECYLKEESQEIWFPVVGVSHAR
ncbi:MAG: GyrI-like domain-containing protein [Oscillospiraceae bacterium]|nr:GyrI-like domain-containing protein [Oscillospiraceae bacterium]